MSGFFRNRALDGATESGGLSESSASSQNRRYNTTKRITEEHFPFALQVDREPQGTNVEFKPHLEKDTFSKSVTIFSFQTITAMPRYRNKSQEELRWEDYKLNNSLRKNNEVDTDIFKSATMVDAKVQKFVEIRSVSMVDQDQRPPSPKIPITTFNHISNDTWSVYDQTQPSSSIFGQQYKTLPHIINGEPKFGSPAVYGTTFSKQQNSTFPNDERPVIIHCAKAPEDSVDASPLVRTPAVINSWAVGKPMPPSTAANRASSSFRTKNTISQELDFFGRTR